MLAPLIVTILLIAAVLLLGKALKRINERERAAIAEQRELRRRLDELQGRTPPKRSWVSAVIRVAGAVLVLIIAVLLHGSEDLIGYAAVLAGVIVAPLAAAPLSGREQAKLRRDIAEHELRPDASPPHA